MHATTETLARVPAEKLVTLRDALAAAAAAVTWREDGSDYIEAIHGNGAAADGVHPMHDIEVDILDLLDVVTDALDRRGYMQS